MTNTDSTVVILSNEYGVGEDVTFVVIVIFLLFFITFCIAIFRIVSMCSSWQSVPQSDEQNQGNPPITSSPIPDGVCSICLEEISPASLVIETNCGHYFCGACILSYYNSRRSVIGQTDFRCPYCRSPINILLAAGGWWYSDNVQNAESGNIRRAILNFNRRQSSVISYTQILRDSPFLLRRLYEQLQTNPRVVFSLLLNMRIISSILLTFIYTISPIDLIPELFFGFFGLIDDICVFIFAFTFFLSMFRNILRQQE